MQFRRSRIIVKHLRLSPDHELALLFFGACQALLLLLFVLLLLLFSHIIQIDDVFQIRLIIFRIEHRLFSQGSFSFLGILHEGAFSIYLALIVHFLMLVNALFSAESLLEVEHIPVPGFFTADALYK